MALLMGMGETIAPSKRGRLSILTIGAKKGREAEAITDLNYIIQLDRRGSNDCVFYECNNPEFVEYVEAFGFVTAHGTFSDISTICPSWGIAGVNLSIGYIDEHSYSEILYVGNMLATIGKVEKMQES